MSINGTHVEGMTSTEVVNIIKGIKGELNVVAKRGDVTPVATAVPITKDGYNPNVVPVRATGIGAPPGNGEWYSVLIEIKNMPVHYYIPR